MELQEAFLYIWTYLPDGRVYLGIHKGTTYDGYHHSSTCEEFNQLFRTEPENFKREILMKGKYDTMRNEEHKVLSMADAKNNPKYFNKSNGAPASKGVDTAKVKSLYEWIRSQTPNLENAEEVSKNISIQIRVADEYSRVYNIASFIDDNRGDTVATGLTVTLLENYFEEDEESYGEEGSAILDGNHSTKATIASKHGVEVPVVRVPLEMYADFSNAEIRLLGNFLNRKTSKLDIKSNSNDDLIKMIVTCYDEENVDPMSEETFDRLSELNVDSRTAKSLMKSAAKRIEENKINMTGKKLIDWTVGESARKLKAKLEEYRESGQLAYTITSGSGGSVQTLLGKVMEDLEEGMTKVTVLVRHSLPSYYEDWNNGEKGSTAREMFAWCLEPRGVEVEFKNLPHVQEDVKFETEVI